MANIPRPVEFTLSSTGSRRLQSWLTRHLQSFFYTLGLLSRAPLASFLTAAVIGMALALPAGLYVLLDNAQDASRGWDRSDGISLFLKLEVGDDGAAKIAAGLRDWPQVAVAACSST